MNPRSHYFIDANLIMYSLGSPHPLRESCNKILGTIKSGRILAVTNTEVLQEILYRYFSLRRSDVGEAAYRSIVRICFPILPITIADTDSALELLKIHKSISSRDAIHAATMINNGLNQIISTDSHFDVIPQIKRIDPRKFAK